MVAFTFYESLSMATPQCITSALGYTVFCNSAILDTAQVVLGDKYIKTKTVLGPFAQPKRSVRISRAVVISNGPLVDEEAMITLTIPPNAFQNTHAVTVMAMGPSMYCAPNGKCEDP